MEIIVPSLLLLLLCFIAPERPGRCCRRAHPRLLGSLSPLPPLAGDSRVQVSHYLFLFNCLPCADVARQLGWPGNDRKPVTCVEECYLRRRPGRN